MFAGFNVKIKDSAFLNESHFNTGREILGSISTAAEKNLKKYICDADYLDGSLMQENWFPEVKADIFLSHSHKNEKTVISLAGWLYEVFGLKSFVDSCIWGYSDDLIKIIDNEYCRKQNVFGPVYSYKKRNYSTSHVHMMLSMALLKMMDSTESLFFINTPDSILLSGTMGAFSLSPWIYAELQMSEMIRHKDLKEYRPEPETGEKETLEAANLQIKYNVKLDHLTDLDSEDLICWQEIGSENMNKYPMDVLYDFKNLLPQTTHDF